MVRTDLTILRPNLFYRIDSLIEDRSETATPKTFPIHPSISEKRFCDGNAKVKGKGERIKTKGKNEGKAKNLTKKSYIKSSGS